MERWPGERNLKHQTGLLFPKKRKGWQCGPPPFPTCMGGGGGGGMEGRMQCTQPYIPKPLLPHPPRSIDMHCQQKQTHPSPNMRHKNVRQPISTSQVLPFAFQTSIYLHFTIKQRHYHPLSSPSSTLFPFFFFIVF